MTFMLTSPGFADGEGRSPELSWQGAPEGTRGYALILHDPDSTKKSDFTHWVLFDVPGNVGRMAEGVGDAVGTPGVNDFGALGYGGPCPAVGKHRYLFDLYALDVPTLGLPPGASRDDVEEAMEGHLLARARLMGTYQRT